MSNFDRAFLLVIGEEAGYVSNPADPGGETKYGISKRAYPNEDIKNLTLDRARFLYQRDYWGAAGCEPLPWCEALLVFDCAANQGVGRAEKLYQLQAGKPAAQFVTDFQAERALHYASLSTFITFGRGWMRRLFRMYNEAQKP